MAADGEKSKDFYGVLGLKKECTATELRNSYKKLAMKWHPDRCLVSGPSGNMKQAEEAKTKFQAIQEAYSVLSDPNKRFLYDVGVYDCEDEEDQNGMGEFLNEMATMISQNKPSETGGQSFEELQKLFEEIFQDDVDTFGSSSSSWSSTTSNSSCSFFSSQYYDPYTAANNKRDSSHMTPNDSKNKTNNQFEGFNIGAGHQENTRTRRGLEDRRRQGMRGNRRDGRKQVSTK